MTIINPFDLSTITIEKLLEQKKILPSEGNKVWRASIFPDINPIEALNQYDKDHIITKVPAEIFDGFTMLLKPEDVVNVTNGKKWIKSKEYGNYDDSVKRFTLLDKPIDYNKDYNASAFLNLPKIDGIKANNVVIEDSQLFHKPGLDVLPLKKEKIDFLNTTDLFSHPHVQPLANTGNFRMNNKSYIMAVLEWARAKGIKYIYCINEWRPNVISDNYTTNLVYYTVKGY